MRFTIYIFILIAIITACSENTQTNTENSTEKITTASIQGKFIRVGDNDRAGLEKFVTIIREVEFKGTHCHFKYMGTPMSGKFEIDEGYIYISTGGELGMLSLEISNNDHLEGEGFIHGTYKREGTYDPSILESKSSSSKTDYTKPKVIQESLESKSDVESQTTHDPNSSDNPFGSSSNSNPSPFGEGGTGTAFSYGDGSGNGVSGNGPSTTTRIRLNDVQLTDVNYDQDVSIYLKLVIDAEGNVVNSTNMVGKSTTTDQVLINKILYAVKKQVRYNKAPGAGLTSVYYTVRIDAN